VKRYYIYELIDPRDNTPFYVGCSRQPQKRLRAHIREAQDGGCNEKSNAIRHLLAVGCGVDIRIVDQIDTTHKKLAFWLELAWAAKCGFEYRFKWSKHVGILTNRRRPIRDYLVHENPDETIEAVKSMADLDGSLLDGAIKQMEEKALSQTIDLRW
jgi:hypothetical protein